MTPLVCVSLTLLAAAVAAVRTARARVRLRAIEAEAGMARASHARLMATADDVEALMRHLHGGGGL